MIVQEKEPLSPQKRVQTADYAIAPFPIYRRINYKFTSYSASVFPIVEFVLAV